MIFENGKSKSVRPSFGSAQAGARPASRQPGRSRIVGTFPGFLSSATTEHVLRPANDDDQAWETKFRILSGSGSLASKPSHGLRAPWQKTWITHRRARRITVAFLSLFILSLAATVAVSVSSDKPRSQDADAIAQRFSNSDKETPPDVAADAMPRYVPLNMLAYLDLATYDYYKRLKFTAVELTAVGAAAPGSQSETSDQQAAKKLPTVKAITIPEPSLVRSSVPPNLIVRDLPSTAAISGGKRISSDSWLVRLQDKKNFMVTLPLNGSKPITAKIEAIREDGTSAGTYIVRLAAIDKDKAAPDVSSDKGGNKKRSQQKKRPPQPPASKESSSYVPASEGNDTKTSDAKSSGAKSAGAKSTGATKVKAWKATSPPAQLALAHTPSAAAITQHGSINSKATSKVLPYLPYYELNENIRKVMNAGP